MERAFTDHEYERILLGVVPEQMEDKWFIFVEDDTLYAHRSWTGYCIYRLSLLKAETGYVAGEAFVNRDESQYSGKDDQYDARLLLYLIDYLLLGATIPLPMPVSVPAGIATELQHHHIIGAGQRAEKEPVNLTIRGMLGWLWRWLLWLFKR